MTSEFCEPPGICYGRARGKHSCEKIRGHLEECGCRHKNHWMNPEQMRSYLAKERKNQE